jgi:serine protease Do
MKERSSLKARWLPLVGMLLIGCVIGAVLTITATGRPVAFAQRVHALGVAPESERAIIAAIAKVGPAVVNIDTVFKPPDESRIPPALRQFFEEPFPRAGQASGVIISQDGYVLTNNHVVQNSRSVKVTLADGRSFDASLVGTDPLSDVGVVRIKDANLPSAALGRSADVPVGGWLIAIGNPFGYENTVTVGVLSARNRRLRAPNGVGLDNLLQTDAAINPGNSGGALADIDGNVVGMPTAIIPYAQGIGFAIAGETAQKVAEQLIKTGHVTHPWLGVYYIPVSAEIQKELKLPDRKGIAVVRVAQGGPADKAGIKPKDVIIRIGNRDIVKPDEVGQMVRQAKVGEQMPITLRRDGKEIKVTVTIGEQPQPQATAAAPTMGAAP